MARAQGLVLGVVRMDLLFGVTIYIYAGIVLERRRPSLGLKNMSDEVERWTL